MTRKGVGSPQCRHWPLLVEALAPATAGKIWLDRTAVSSKSDRAPSEGNGGRGGGIYSFASLTLNNSVVRGNTASEGGVIYDHGDPTPLIPQPCSVRDRRLPV